VDVPDNFISAPRSANSKTRSGARYSHKRVELALQYRDNFRGSAFAGAVLIHFARLQRALTHLIAADQEVCPPLCRELQILCS